jgi:hypothetical protein
VMPDALRVLYEPPEARKHLHHCPLCNEAFVCFGFDCDHLQFETCDTCAGEDE